MGKRLTTPQRRARSASKYCAARKRDGSECNKTAGWGTTHKGIGRCKFHGGNLPNVKKNAAKVQAILMGAPVEINPLDALIWCIKITAGEVEFCSQQLEILNKEEWLEHTLLGKQVHIWAKERQRAVERLAKFSKDALALGIAERAVRMAEQYGNSIARLLKGVLEDLELSPAQKAIAPKVIRKHLILLEGGQMVTDEDRKNLPEIPKRVA